MQKLIVILIILIAFTAGGCATTKPDVIPVQGASTVDLQGVVERLKTLNEGSVQAKRTAAVAALDNWLIDGGYWAVIFENSRMRPDAEVQSAVEQFTVLAREREKLKEQGKELCDYDLGRALGYYTIVVAGIIKYGAQEIIPQIAQLLSVF